MSSQPDLRAIMDKAASQLRTARFLPLRITLLFLVLLQGLSLLGSAAERAFGVGSVELPFVSGSLIDIPVALLGAVLLMGLRNSLLRIHRGEDASCASLFSAFPFAGKALLLELLTCLLIGLGLLLLVIPGVILACAYSPAAFYLCDDPGAGAAAALRRSRREMRGRKGRIFGLHLSFLLPALVVQSIKSVFEPPLSQLRSASPAGSLLAALAGVALYAVPAVCLLAYVGLSLAGFYRCVSEPGGDAASGDAPPSSDPAQTAKAPPARREPNQ